MPPGLCVPFSSTGCPAAAIRARPWSICFLNWALNPHAGVFAALLLVRSVTPRRASVAGEGSNSALPLDAGLLDCQTGDADVQLDRSHALAPLWSIARLLNTGSAAGASCAA